MHIIGMQLPLWDVMWWRWKTATGRSDARHNSWLRLGRGRGGLGMSPLLCFKMLERQTTRRGCAWHASGIAGLSTSLQANILSNLLQGDVEAEGWTPPGRDIRMTNLQDDMVAGSGQYTRGCRHNLKEVFNYMIFIGQLQVAITKHKSIYLCLL